MERGSRLINCFLSIERVTAAGQRSASKMSPEELQQLRFLMGKVLQYVSSQEKIHRDVVLKNSGYLDLLLLSLENVRDICVEQHLIFIISELIGKAHTAKRVSCLVSHGATHALLQVLVSEARQPGCPEELLLNIHQILAKLGPKDRKFGVKARLVQTLGITLNLLKNNTGNPKALLPVVQVLKHYSANAVNASYLGKSGAVSLLFKVLAICGRKHLILVKYALTALGLLVKSKSNSARAIGQGGVPVLLTMFYEWHRVDSKNRHVALRKALLTVLKHVTNLQSGRKALMDADGIRILYTICQESADCRELENLIYMASLIMRKCFPRNRLPLHSLRSPVTCALPRSDYLMADTSEGQDSPEELSDRTGEETGYESSVDNDDDVSSDDDIEAHKLGSDDEGEGEYGSSIPARRNWEDLCQYRKYFAEQYEFDSLVDDDLSLRSNVPQIIIPTALYERGQVSHALGPIGPLTGSALGLLGPQHRRYQGVNHSGPALLEPELPDEALSGMINDLRMGGAADKYRHSGSVGEMGYAGHEAPVRGTGRGREFSDRIGDADAHAHAHTQAQAAPPCAVNLKTGASVFSLDYGVPPPPPPVTAAPKSAKNALQRSPKLKRKAKNGKSKDKGSKAKSRAMSDDSTSSASVAGGAEHAQCAAASGRPVVVRESRSSEENEASLGCSNGDAGEDCRYLQRREAAEAFAEMAARTKSVGRFNKVTYPELYGHVAPPFKEPLFEKKFGTQRQKIFEDIDRFLSVDQTLDKVVYDLDSIVTTAGPTYKSAYSCHTNMDEARIMSGEDSADHLRFNSQFESGNLRKAVQVRKFEYDLILNPDVNSNHQHQWFYFEVSNVESAVRYRFNIVNCEKVNSQFNFGMKPVMFSVSEAMEGRPYWTRVGSEICYYKNHFVRSSQTTGGVKGKTYFTTTFTVLFKHDRDVCYLAYHYPYTYSMLQYHITRWEKSLNSNQVYYRNDTMCDTIGGNSVPVLTVTSHPQSYDREGVEQLRNRPYIFLSSRVHPGESNSSWVMKGTIDYLLSDRASAQTLRDTYIFKIVPMLNPDGVINGNHRCSLAAEDLNRRWMRPCPRLHPTIYHTKGLLQYLQSNSKPPLVFCDYHGHSRKKNVFLYGCSPGLSWMGEDLDNPNVVGNRVEDTSYKTLPKILQQVAPAFSLSNCNFMLEKSKETTARVVVWRQIGVVRSYTMESSYCGCDQGPYKGHHLSIRELEEMGRKFCEALQKVKSRHLKGAPPQGVAALLGQGSQGGRMGLGLGMAPSPLPDLDFMSGFPSGNRTEIDSVLEGATGGDGESGVEPLDLPSGSDSNSLRSTEEEEEGEGEEPEAGDGESVNPEDDLDTVGNPDGDEDEDADGDGKSVGVGEREGFTVRRGNGRSVTAGGRGRGRRRSELMDGGEEEGERRGVGGGRGRVDAVEIGGDLEPEEGEGEGLIEVGVGLGDEGWDGFKVQGRRGVGFMISTPSFLLDAEENGGEEEEDEEEGAGAEEERAGGVGGGSRRSHTRWDM